MNKLPELLLDLAVHFNKQECRNCIYTFPIDVDMFCRNSCQIGDVISEIEKITNTNIENVCLYWDNQNE